TLELVASLPRPGGNITGLTTVNIELAGKQVELLKEMVPHVSRVAILWEEAIPAAEFNVKETEAAAASVGLTLHVFAVRSPKEFSSANIVVRVTSAGKQQRATRWCLSPVGECGESR